MKTIFLLFPVLLLFLLSCTSPVKQDTLQASGNTASGPFFGFKGDSVPQILMPNFISTSNPETNGTFSTDGKEFVYSVWFPGLNSTLISTSLLADNTWSEPEIMPFSGQYTDVDPLFSPDGKRLYFTSRRPPDATGTEPKDADIWYVERLGQGWSEPKNIGLPVNTEGNEFYNSVASNGNVYFNTQDEVSNSSNIYVAIKTEDGYKVEDVGEPVNTDGYEGDPFISPNEDFLLFVSYREGGLGGADLYISFKEQEGWGNPILLEEPVNSSYDDKMPALSKDNQYLIFTSGRMKQSWKDVSGKKLKEINSKIASLDNGLEKIYMHSADFIEKLRPATAQSNGQAKK